MTWLVMTLPGAGTQQRAGFIYEAQRLLEENLPEFNHVHEQSTHKRLERDLEAGRQVCSTLTLEHPGRSKFGFFAAYVPAPPMELVSRAGLLPPQTLNDGKVSLAKLISTPLKGGIASTRGYPSELADLIQAGIREARIKVINTSSPGVNLIAMIAHERLDYTIEFPAVASELTKGIAPARALVSLPIVENPHLVPAGIYCPRNEWGRRMIVGISAAIQRLARSPESLLQLYSESQRGAYEHSIRAFFRSRSLASPDL